MWGRNQKYRSKSQYKQAVFGEHRVCRDYSFEKRRKWKKRLLFSGAIVLAGGIFYGLFLTPFLNIKGIEIERQENVYYPVKNSEIKIWAEEAEKGKWLWLIDKHHRWFYPKRVVIKKISEVLPVESCKFEITWDGKMTIKIKDLYPAMSLKNSEKWYYLDADGKVIKEISDFDLDKGIPEIYFSNAVLGIAVSEENVSNVGVANFNTSTNNTSSDDIVGESESSLLEPKEIIVEGPASDEKGLSEEEMRAGFTLEEILAKLDQPRVIFFNLLVKRYSELIDDKILRVTFIDPTLLDVLVKTQRGYNLYFDPKIDLDQQLNNFELLRQKTLNGRRPKYIDLRYTDRLYYSQD